MQRLVVADCDRRDAVKWFRIHWAGDFFSAPYTAAWRGVIVAFPDVHFWVYTRSAPAAAFLHAQKLPNLVLYFSADVDNIDVARHLESQGVRIAYTGTTFAEGKAAMPRATRCPHNNKAIPLSTAAGSACARCGLCIHGRNDVLFSTTKR